jgi:putative oxidoreductase
MSFHTDDIAKLLVRLSTGFVLLPYGLDYAKDGLDFIYNQLQANGLPTFLGYGVFIGEILAPILVLIGWQSRIGGLLIAINMLVSILLVHRAQIFEYNEFGGWAIALNVMLLMGGAAVFFGGSGRYSVSRGAGKWD